MILKNCKQVLCYNAGLTDIKRNGHSNGWPQGKTSSNPLNHKIHLYQIPHGQLSFDIYIYIYIVKRNVCKSIRYLRKISGILTSQSLNIFFSSIPNSFTFVCKKVSLAKLTFSTNPNKLNYQENTSCIWKRFSNEL